MFDIAWTELLVIAVVTIIVVGPKELPRLLRTIGQYTGKIRKMANEFKLQLDDAVKETGLDDIKSDLEGLKDTNPVSDLRNALNPMAEDFEKDFEQLADEEDFDDPAAEDDGEDSWQLWNDTDGKSEDRPAAKSSGKKPDDGTQIVEPAQTANADAPPDSQAKPLQDDAEEEPAASQPATSGPPRPAPPAPVLKKAANGAHPPGLDSGTGKQSLTEKTEV